MLAQARAASAFGTLKVKLGFDGDLDLARRLKLELPETTFRYDANEGWDRERAATALAVLEDLDAELVEQPLPAADAEGMAWLKERTRIPLLADEAVLTLDDLDAVGDAYDGVVVKLAKAGGIASAFALISACTELGLRVLIGCMVESSLGIAAALQLAGLADYVDLDGALLLAEDPFTGHRRGRRPAHRVRGAGAGGAAGRLTRAGRPVYGATAPARSTRAPAPVQRGLRRAPRTAPRRCARPSRTRRSRASSRRAPRAGRRRARARSRARTGPPASRRRTCRRSTASGGR